MKAFLKLYPIIANKPFSRLHADLLFDRIKWVSCLLIITYPCFFYVDFFLFNSVQNHIFRSILTGVHLTGFLYSLFFLLFSKKIPFHMKNTLILLSVIFYLLLGLISSLNSQLFTGNIDAYVIILIAVAAIFPLPPIKSSFLFGCTQIFFLIGLTIMGMEHNSLLTKEINSTGAAIIAFFISFTFFSYKQKDFRYEQRLKDDKENFHTLFHINPNPLMIIRVKDHQILLMNQHARDYYHLPDLETADGGLFFKDPYIRESILNRLMSERSIKNYVMEHPGSHPSHKWSLLNMEWVEYAQESCILIGSTDITHLKQKEEELLEHASVDPLTGVLNRRSGISFLEDLLHKPVPPDFILGFMDINDLKKVNDQFGHSAGDELIKKICTIVQEKMGSSDVFFRFGGDEFILVSLEMSVESIEAFWDSVIMEFEHFNTSPQAPYALSVSLGFIEHRKGSRITVEELLEHADKEMYKEKQRYKQQLSF